MKILIADDHSILRRGLRLILAGSRHTLEIGEAADGRELLQKVEEEPWDVLILDLSFPSESGLDMLRETKRIRPFMPVLVLSMHAEEQYAVRALRSGAAGYLTKESAPEELLRAVDKVAAGGRFVTVKVAEALAAEISGELYDSPERLLSDREFEVFRLIARGHSGSEIARQLGLSAKTVGTYRSRIKEKMGLTNNAEIIRYAVLHQLV